MATTLSVGPQDTRGFALTVYATFGVADFTDTVGLEAFRVPIGSTIVNGRFSITTAWASGTSTAVLVGDATDPNRYLAAGDAETVTNDELIEGLGYAVVAADVATVITVTKTGTVSTVGAGNILACYLDPNYNTINYE